MAKKGVLLCLISSVLTGYAGHTFGLPLAWVLGPLIITAAFSIGGVIPYAPLAGRRVGQIIIGAAIGLNVTPAVAGTVIAWLPMMIITSLISMFVGSACAIGLARLGRIDLKTAYFCMMPGGLSEMANIGAKHGAQSEHIALTQALRIAIVVCILPPLLVALGLEGEFYNRTLGQDVPGQVLPLLAVAGLTGVLLVRLLRLNNPWMIGSLVGVGIVTAFGYFEGRMPREIFYGGQFLLGISIGARFRRDVVFKLKKFTLISSCFVVMMAGCMFAYAVVLAYIGGIDIASAALSSSPGGFAEMAVTAEVLHLNIALVTAFHIIRAMLVNGFTTQWFGLLDKIGFFRAGGKLLAKLF